MLDKHLRVIKDDVLHPIAAKLGEHFSPTEITLVGGAIGLAAAAFAWQGWYAAGLVLWIVNRVFDGLDGSVARIYNKQSDFGGYLDILVDHLAYATIPLGLALSIGTPIAYLGLIFLLAAYYVNSASWMILSSILEKRNFGAKASGELTTVTMADSIMGGTETIAFFILFFLLPQFLPALFVIKGTLVIFTIFHRLHWAIHNLD